MRSSVIVFTILLSLAACSLGEPAIERCDPMPKIVTAEHPQIPAGMHHPHEGAFLVEFVIEKSGTVRDPAVVSSSINHPRAELLYRASYDAMSNWRYESPSKPCRGRTTIVIRFVD